MSRKEHKPDEVYAKNHIHTYLNIHYPGYTTDESFTDDPDYVFMHESKRIGVEFSHITIEQLMEWTARKQFDQLKHDVRYILTIPIEPHMWIQRCLNDKNPLFTKYIKNGKLDECWLLLHQGDNSRKWFIPDNPKLLEVMQVYASNSSTKFKKILYLHQNNEISELKVLEKKGIKHVLALTPILQEGWRAQELTLVQTTINNGMKYVNLEEIPIEDHVFIPYLESGVRHGDPRSKA